MKRAPEKRWKRRVCVLLLCIVLGLVMCSLQDVSAQGALQGKIVFSSLTPDGWRIRSVEADGKNLRQMATGPGEEHFPAVSPDGKEILFIGAGRMIWIMNADGSNRRQLPLPKGIYAQPVWAPGGQEIAFVKYTVTPSDQSEIWTMKRQGEKWRDAERLSAYPPMRIYPSYSPDGSKLAYTEFKRDQRLGAVEEIGIFDIDQKRFKAVTADLTDSFKPVWSPTGEEIAFTSNKGGNYDIWVISVKNGKQRQVTTDPAYDGEPAWSPDGREMVFISTRNGSKEIWVMSATGEHPRQATKLGKGCKDPFWAR
jgi:TolB protein